MDLSLIDSQIIDFIANIRRADTGNQPAEQRKQSEHPTRKSDNCPEQAMHFPKDARLSQWFPGQGVFSFF